MSCPNHAPSPLLALHSSESQPLHLFRVPCSRSTHGYRGKKTRNTDLGPEGVSDKASTNQQRSENQSELISRSGHLVPEELGKNYSSPDAMPSTGTSSRFIQWFFHVSSRMRSLTSSKVKQARQELKIPMKRDRPSKKRNNIEHCID